jgi:predicted Fe-Mo cluster-binding NifX family protein
MQLFVYLTILLTLSGSAGLLRMSREEATSSRIAVTAQGPELTSQVSARFGQSRFIILVDLESGSTTVIERAHPARSRGADLANQLIKSRVDVVISGRIGGNVDRILRAAEVHIIRGISGTVEDTLRRFESGEFGDRGLQRSLSADVD